MSSNGPRSDHQDQLLQYLDSYQRLQLNRAVTHLNTWKLLHTFRNTALFRSSRVMALALLALQEVAHGMETCVQPVEQLTRKRVERRSAYRRRKKQKRRSFSGS